MDLEKINLEFDEEEINRLIKKLNDLYEHQQGNFATLCYTVYKIDCWFSDNPDCLLKAKYNADYYNKKQLFKSLGISNRLRERYINCFKKFMTQKNDDIVAEIKEPFVSFTSSKLFELLPFSYDILVKFIDSGQLSANMTVKEIREFFKTLEEKEDSEEESTENFDPTENENFIVLKNDTARQDFLSNYKTWGLWFEEPRLGLKYYRCKIGNEIIVAVSGRSQLYKDIIHDFVYYCELNSVGSLTVGYSLSDNQIFAKMKAVSDKRVYLF